MPRYSRILLFLFIAALSSCNQYNRILEDVYDNDYKTINDIFKNYGLTDQMEVQPAQMSEFNKIITEPDSRKRAI